MHVELWIFSSLYLYQGVWWNSSWKYWKSPGILLMLQENFITSNVIFAHQAIFSALYIGKSSGKQGQWYCMACHVKKIFYNFMKMYPGSWLGCICRHPVIVMILHQEMNTKKQILTHTHATIHTPLTFNLFLTLSSNFLYCAFVDFATV